MTFPSISLIIPCYNESLRIARLFEGIEQFAQQWQGDFECILVDDGSNDATCLLIEAHPLFYELKKKNRAFLLQQLNTGKGGALKNGIARATKEFTLTLDADMAAWPVELIRWLKIRNQFYDREILIGSRELKQSFVKSGHVRRFLGQVFNFILSNITGLQVKDTQCGFKLYATSAAKMLFKDLETLGWSHDVEILLRANKKGLAVIEMPICWQAIEGSKINVYKDSFIMLWDIIQISRKKFQ